MSSKAGSLFRVKMKQTGLFCAVVSNRPHVLSQAKAGDLIFFHSTYNAGSYVTHVGIYVGNNQMYHAGDPIGYADLSSSYWQQHLIGAGRVKQ